MDLPALAANSIRLALTLALPALIAAFAVGALLALFDLTTQGTDSSISFVPRILAVALVLFVGREFLSTELLHFTSSILHTISLVQH
jgi:flagellar biosynthetic protein FliQ